MATPPSTNQRAELEAWWAFLARILAFFLGGGILAWQTVSETSDRLYLIVAAIGLMGPTVAQSVAVVLAALKGVIASVRGGPAE